jgi:putative DNA primase/helicase
VTGRRIRHVERLVLHPFVDRNGAIILTSGYYEDLRIYPSTRTSPSVQFQMRSPTQTFAWAIATLREPTKSVCFEDDHSRNVPPLTILTVIELPNGAKPPCFFITAPFPGSGKSVIADIGHVVAFGERAPTATLSGSNEETRKALTTYVRDGRSVVVLDKHSERASCR